MAEADIGVKALLGDDWPPVFPLTLEQREVEMVVEESVHHAAGAPGAGDEWWYERGYGFDGAGRIGADNRRTFAVTRSTTKSTVCSTCTRNSRIAPARFDSRTTNTA